MRKFLLFVLIFGITISFGNPVRADMEDKVANHWSKDLIEREFFLYYFPYLAKENFKRFNPNDLIYEDEFLLSFSSLLKEKGYSNTSIGSKKNLNRIDMAKIIGNKLMEVNLIKWKDEKLPFIDIDNILVEERKAINALYHSGILQGESDNIYNPKRNVTQAEAIIVLQRVNKLLDNITNIPFKLSGVVQAYSGKEGIVSKIDGDKVLVTITKEFPTPGYSVEVKEILKTQGGYKINLNIVPPDKDSLQLQVITYKILTIEIEKENLGDPPYNFVLGDFLLK